VRWIPEGIEIHFINKSAGRNDDFSVFPDKPAAADRRLLNRYLFNHFRNSIGACLTISRIRIREMVKQVRNGIRNPA